MLYQNLPKNFSSKYDVVGCLCQCHGKILLLKRVKNDNGQAGKWGAPGGKREEGESLANSVVRELHEELRHKITPKSLKYLTKFYVHYPEFDFVYHLFTTNVTEEFTPFLNPEEHSDYSWIELDEALKLDLMLDMDKVLKYLHE